MNTATVTSASDPNGSNDSATALTAVAAQADLGITKTGPASVALGQNITYTINITNTGALAAANTFVSDPTPAGVTPVSVSGGGCSAFPCAVGTINPGGSIAIAATYNVPFAYASPSVSNTASGWNTYCLDTVDFNTASNYFSVNGSGVVTFIKPGYYEINYWGIANGTGNLRLFRKIMDAVKLVALVAGDEDRESLLEIATAIRARTVPVAS